MRKSNTQLPTADELKHILTGESQRMAVKHDFLQRYPEIFSAYRELARCVGENVGWIDEYAKMSLESAVSEVHSSTDALAKLLLDGSVDLDIRDNLFDLLALNESPRQADAIFVFGSPADARITKAVELFHEGMAPKLIVSGRGPHYDTSNKSEASRMARFAVNAGVPIDAVMQENDSITLPDNVKRTLDMFEIQGYYPARICIVATAYIMRRAYMEWYKFTPWEVDLIPVSASSQAPELCRNSWFNSERGIRMLLNEYAKMVLEHKMDLERAG